MLKHHHFIIALFSGYSDRNWLLGLLVASLFIGLPLSLMTTGNPTLFPCDRNKNNNGADTWGNFRATKQAMSQNLKSYPMWTRVHRISLCEFIVALVFTRRDLVFAMSPVSLHKESPCVSAPWHTEQIRVIKVNQSI